MDGRVRPCPAGEPSRHWITKPPPKEPRDVSAGAPYTDSQGRRPGTDNGPNYTAKTFHRTVTAVARHQRIRAYTPRHNGKVERYNRTLAEELLYARVWTCEAERAAAITVWNIHYNYHRAHTAVGDQPPASRLHTGVTNVMSQNN